MQVLLVLAVALGWHYWNTRVGSRPERAPSSGDSRPAPPDKGDDGLLRLGTWNLKRLGQGKKRLDQVARIIADLDVVALQEVMSPEAVDQLLAYLPGFRAEISPRAVGNERYQEFYAVLYRPERASVERAFFARDARDRFFRDPFVVCMRARAFDFCLVNVHVIYGDKAVARDREITALGATLEELRRSGPEKDWILAGDFNRMPGAPGWDALLGAGWSFTARATLTSLGKSGYRNAYDHILVDPESTRELAGDAEKIDFVSRACAGDFAACSRDLTDHAPLVARFRTTGPDDD